MTKVDQVPAGSAWGKVEVQVGMDMIRPVFGSDFKAGREVIVVAFGNLLVTPWGRNDRSGRSGGEGGDV